MQSMIKKAAPGAVKYFWREHILSVKPIQLRLLTYVQSKGRIKGVAGRAYDHGFENTLRSFNFLSVNSLHFWQAWLYCGRKFF